MIAISILLLIPGFILKIAIPWSIGMVVLTAGLTLALPGATGRAVGGLRP
jgi:hypothetical protein